MGTNSGTVFIYVLTNDKISSNGTWQLAKEVQLKHKAPIVFIRLLDPSGAPIFENNSDHDRHSFNRVLICSEEQFKLFSLPNFKTLHKFKLTAHEGARVRKIDLGLFTNKNNEYQSEYSLMCLSNLGDGSIFSLSDFKRKYQNHFLKKEDINGITSLVFTKFGEGFYLRSSSEYQRFSLSSKRTNFPECFIQLPELEQHTEDIQENIVAQSVAFTEEHSNEAPVLNNESTESALDLDSSHSTAASQSNLNSTVDSVIEHNIR